MRFASLVAPERLRSFFAPRGIALVGASENSGWARFIVASCATAGFTGPLIPVHPRASTAFGLPVARRLSTLSSLVDLAFILTPVPAVEGVLDDMASAGIPHAVVLAAGYREVGASGSLLEEALVARAAAHGITMLGPNGLGFVNAHARAAPFALLLPPPLLAGPVGIALQSGALASVVLNFAKAHAIGISLLVSMGNESMIKTADVVDYLVEDEATKVICLFLEEVGDPAKFAAAAARADHAGKPIVALKAGSSPAGQQSALAHTGSVAGDDAVVSAFLRQLNVIRVGSLEELLATGSLLGYSRLPRGRRMGVLTVSGGSCDLIADASAAEGISIPPFSPTTVDAIAPHLPPFAGVRNPLDATGFGSLANLSSRTSALIAVDHALDAAVCDPSLDFVLSTGLALPEVRPPDERMALLLEERVAWTARRLASSPIPVILADTTCQNVSEYARGLLVSAGIRTLPGVSLGVRALGNALRWAEGRGRRLDGLRPASVSGGVSGGVAGAWPEERARSFLASAGIPVVPGGLAGSAEEAVRIASSVGLPVVAKICSAQIAHKSDAGGVALGLGSSSAVRSGYARVRAAAPADAVVDGVLITAMRSGGVELLAGVSVDPVFGPVLAVGLGGIWVEVLGDTSLRVLPVTAAEIRQMLLELRGLPLLSGGRGGMAADLDRVASVIASIASAALSLNGELRALEVNPLWVNGDQVEALDALVVTSGLSGLSRQEILLSDSRPRIALGPGSHG